MKRGANVKGGNKKQSTQKKKPVILPLVEEEQINKIMERVTVDPESVTSNDVMRLQRAVGNQAVNQLLTQSDQSTTTTKPGQTTPTTGQPQVIQRNGTEEDENKHRRGGYQSRSSPPKIPRSKVTAKGLGKSLGFIFNPFSAVKGHKAVSKQAKGLSKMKKALKEGDLGTAQKYKNRYAYAFGQKQKTSSWVKGALGAPVLTARLAANQRKYRKLAKKVGALTTPPVNEPDQGELAPPEQTEQTPETTWQRGTPERLIPYYMAPDLKHKVQIMNNPEVELGKQRHWAETSPSGPRGGGDIKLGEQRRKWQGASPKKGFFGPEMEMGKHRVWQEAKPQGEKSPIPGIELGKQRWHSASPNTEGEQSGLQLGKHRVWQGATPQGEKSPIPGIELGKQRWHSASPGQEGKQNPDTKLGWQRLLLNLPPEMGTPEREQGDVSTPELEELLMNLPEEEMENPGFDLLEDEESMA